MDDIDAVLASFAYSSDGYIKILVDEVYRLRAELKRVRYY